MKFIALINSLAVAVIILLILQSDTYWRPNFVNSLSERYYPYSIDKKVDVIDLNFKSTYLSQIHGFLVHAV